MRQNINLYEAPRAKTQPAFSRRGVLVLTALSIVSVLALHTFGVQDNVQLTEELKRVKRDKERIEQLLAKAPAADTVARRQAGEEAEVAALELIAARLSAGSLDRAASFAEQLRALSRATAEGVWLTGIRINNDTGGLLLEGRALEADRVPALLEALRRQPQFAGLNLAAMELKSPSGAEAKKAAPLVHFRIRTPETQARLGATAPAAPADSAGGTTAAVTAPASSPQAQTTAPATVASVAGSSPSAAAGAAPTVPSHQRGRP